MSVLAKGVNFLFSKRFIEIRYGMETWDRLLGSLSKESREIWDSALLVQREYPFEAYKEMITALTLELKSASNGEVASIYEYVADQSLNRVYKIFFQLSNPAFVIKNYPKLWERFFSAGKVEVSVSEKGHAILKFILPEIFLDWITPACLGYSRKAVEMAGGKDLSMQKKDSVRLADGSWEILYELRWRE